MQRKLWAYSLVHNIIPWIGFVVLWPFTCDSVINLAHEFSTADVEYQEFVLAKLDSMTAANVIG